MSSEEQVPVAERLIDNIDRGRFELYRHHDLVGWLYYTRLKPNRYALRHTEVESSHHHQGVGGTLVGRVFDEIRSREGTVTAICPFVVDYLSRTTTYADLVDPRHPGYTVRAAAESALTAPDPLPVVSKHR
ncbi:GNAT family N-acetyltransferase [Streptomyces sp. NPDC050788]|uniref:GNAT family N-acetyltransferase n=1 Tax=Streptomyces sp. NPDC050788 TaxID=3155041 RepID=UPI00341DE0E8